MALEDLRDHLSLCISHATFRGRLLCHLVTGADSKSPVRRCALATWIKQGSWDQVQTAPRCSLT